MASFVLGVIGGSGIYDVPGLTNVEELRTGTPFGWPSDAVVKGRLGEVELLFLPRHGRGHPIPPHQINYRANIAALKRLGAYAPYRQPVRGGFDEGAHRTGTRRRRRSVHRFDENVGRARSSKTESPLTSAWQILFVRICPKPLRTPRGGL